jgi:hypothetical protein
MFWRGRSRRVSISVFGCAILVVALLGVAVGAYAQSAHQDVWGATLNADQIGSSPLYKQSLADTNTRLTSGPVAAAVPKQGSAASVSTPNGGSQGVGNRGITTAGNYTCGSTCSTTCAYTCLSTCASTCSSTCGVTCIATSCSSGTTCASTCYGSSTCAGSATCLGTSTCSNTCAGTATCASTCSGATCGTTCSGTATCAGGTTCSTTCGATCSGTATCAGSTTCGSACGAPSIGGFTPTSGPVGSTVTLTGSFLADSTAVTFNGAAATFTVDSDTQITATVPTGASSGTIAVTTAAGTATSATSFTVTAAPTVTLMLSGLKSGAIRLGKSVTAKGTVTPTSLAGRKITLTVQKKSGTKWVKAKTGVATLSATGAYGWRYKPTTKGAYRVQAKIAKTTTSAAATTKWRSFKVK